MALYKQKGSQNRIFRQMVSGKMYVKSTKTPIKRLAETVAKRYHEEAIKERVLSEGEPIALADALDMYVATQQGSSRKAYQYQAKYLKQYLGGATNKGLYVLENSAKTSKAGLWRDPHPIPPWEYRHGRSRSNERKKRAQLRSQADVVLQRSNVLHQGRSDVQCIWTDG